MEAVITKMKCQRCGNELTEDPKRNCKVCLVCYPNALKVKPVPPPKKQENKRVGLSMTEERVREIVREELSKIGHIQKPQRDMTATEVITDDDDFGEMTATEVAEARKGNTEIKDWRGQAKALGISLYHKTKKTVLADIAEKTKSPQVEDNPESS